MTPMLRTLLGVTAALGERQISFFVGHDSSIAVGSLGRIECVLELERLFKERYFRFPRQDFNRFTAVLMGSLEVLRQRCDAPRQGQCRAVKRAPGTTRSACSFGAWMGPTWTTSLH